MPKYYCDYCDTYLTHDSPSVRKTHNGGRKHKENVRIYYTKWMEDQAQSLIDQTTAQMKMGSQPPSQMLLHQPGPPVVMPVTMMQGHGHMGGMNPAMMRGPMMGGPMHGQGVPFGRPPPGMGMQMRRPPGMMRPPNGM